MKNGLRKLSKISFVDEVNWDSEMKLICEKWKIFSWKIICWEI